MQKTEVHHDFGLRSIKAIIGIAGHLKMQAQNITESELTEIIDDASLKLTPYSAEQVLQEVMTATEADIAETINSKKKTGKQSSIKAEDQSPSKRSPIKVPIENQSSLKDTTEVDRAQINKSSLSFLESEVGVTND